MALSFISIFTASSQISIEECVRLAEDNYPLIKKYDLLSATQDVDLSDIDRSWLPRIGLYGQLTGQNVVPSFPRALTGVFEQMGEDVRGLGKFQYKVGADISQTIWDGGVSSVRREIVRSREEVRKAALDVELYAVRERVENIFFAILLTDEQIAQQKLTRDLLLDNLKKIRSMVRNGTALQSDADMMEAQALTVEQSITQALSASKGYRDVLGIFIGRSLDGTVLTKPTVEEPSASLSERPELKLFDDKLKACMLSDRLAATSVMPKVGLFAQAYYGYPGFNYFESMISRNLSFNILAGVKVSWNIDSYYTRKNSARRSVLESREIEADRDIFLFNSGIQTASLRNSIDGIRNMMRDDSKIIALRAGVRRTAESQLENGVIDVNALLTRISDENQARLAAQLHEIQLIREIYKLKYILNR